MEPGAEGREQVKRAVLQEVTEARREGSLRRTGEKGNPNTPPPNPVQQFLTAYCLVYAKCVSGTTEKQKQKKIMTL